MYYLCTRLANSVLVGSNFEPASSEQMPWRHSTENPQQTR
jgi:hypothetical protein